MTTQNKQTANRPNIIVILVDDMGFSDIGCYGSEIRTPNLDTMAGDGVRFTQMYNCARCCPTRASLLTGLYPHQAGVGHMVADRGVGPAYQGYLRKDCVTIGEALKQSGYHTCYAGKWHASPGFPVVGDVVAPPGSDRNPAPFSRGFNRFYGTLAGACNYFNPHGLMDQDRRITIDRDDYYYTDIISEKACDMIAESSNGNQPFFLHVCYTAPHWPLHALPEDIERYRGKYLKGWDHFRTARHEQMKGYGILSSAWDISPRDQDSRDFSNDTHQRQEWEDLRMAVYAAQVETMDRGVGQILQALRDNDIEQDTMVMFLSDNGGCAEFLREDGNRDGWPGWYARMARSEKDCTVGNIEGLAPGPETTFMSYDLPWANVSNTPFRLYKHWVHEGGISTPFVVRWPGIATPGHIVHRPCHVIDIMATCMDIAQADYPTEFNGSDIQPMEGESFSPLLHGIQKKRERPIFWEHEGNRAVRDGDWKLVRKHPGNWELYNMLEDRTELNDLSRHEKARNNKMVSMYAEWATRCGILDWPLT